MGTFLAGGGHEKSRRSKELPIDAWGVGWLALLLRRVQRLRTLQYVLLFAGIPLACPAASGAVTLAWDESDPNVAGYRLYYGIASRTYPLVIDVGPATSCSISNLVFGATYFFAVTAYSHVGMESEFSPEIIYTPGLRIASIVSNGQGSSLTWQTRRGATYRVLVSHTLTDPLWVDVSGPLPAFSTMISWTHVRVTSDSCTFYRIEELSR
jgi:hypothetical protein